MKSTQNAFTAARAVFTRARALVGALAIGALTATFLISDFSPARADDFGSPIVGSFAVGAGMTGGIDEATGAFNSQIPVASLPGLGGGAVDLTVSYRHEFAAGEDRFGLGSAWTWNVSHIATDSGVKVFPASGGAYDADVDEQSGLKEYLQGDIFFSQEPNELPARDGQESLQYQYSLAYIGGQTDYFNQAGDLIARADAFGTVVRWEWDANHRLMRVIDSAGSALNVSWAEDGRVTFVAPARSDGVIPTTVFGIDANRLASVTDPVGQEMTFGYDGEGLLNRVSSESGAVTEISYRDLPNNHLPQKMSVVQTVRVSDSMTGAELSRRDWEALGEHNAYGAPGHAGRSALWASGDAQYRYMTQLSDGETRVMFEYNSMGLLISRDVVVRTPSGDVTAQEQDLVYAGTAEGGVPNPDDVPRNYAKPSHVQALFRDGTNHTREVAQETVFDDAGRPVEEIEADGTRTTTVYDDRVPQDKRLPIGLVVQQTTTATDGTVSKTVNTLSDDFASVVATETSTGTSGEASLKPASLTTYTVDDDGFVSEQRVVATFQPDAGPSEVVTRFDRKVDHGTKTVSFSQATAAGTSAESVTSVVSDLTTGLSVKEADPTGRIATTTYDAAGRVISETNFANRTMTTEYDGNVTRVTDPAGVIQSQHADVLGRVVKVTDNIKANNGGEAAPETGFERVVETTVYENNSSKITTTDQYGSKTTVRSDVFGRATDVTMANGVRHITEHNDVNNTAVSGVAAPSVDLDQAQMVTETRKDDRGRVVEENSTRRDGVPVPTSKTSYDGIGRVTERVDEDLATRIEFNPDGTPKTTTVTPTAPESFPGRSVTAEREHDLFGAPTKKTLRPADGEAREGVSRSLDAAGRTVAETNQMGAITTFTYETDGLVARLHNGATDAETRNVYDPVTRELTLTETVAADGKVSATGFEYDAKTGNMLAVFDPANREETQLRYRYDAFRNTTEISYPDGKTLRHIFDEDGREKASIDVAGNVTEYDFDAMGRLSSASQSAPSSAVLSTVSYKYDDFGRMVKLSRDNGVTTEYTYTSADQIKTEKTVHGSALIFEASYEYDPHGNLTQRVDNRPNTNTQPGSTESVAETTTYRYDAYNRLLASAVYDAATASGEPRIATEYQLNVSGDVTHETVTRNAGAEPATTIARGFEYTSSGHLTVITSNENSATTNTVQRIEQHYDNAGNLIQSVDGTRYTYNAYNQPITETHPDGSIVTNSYWANGQHRSSTTIRSAEGSSEQSTTVGLYWDGITLVNDVHTTNAKGTPDSTSGTPGVTGAPGSATVGSYLIGVSRHARTLAVEGDGTATDASYYVTDRHGNVTALTGEAGTVSETYAYTDYGRTTVIPADNIPADDASAQHENAAERNPFQYSGEYTTESGPQYLGVRHYDPSVMRFTTQDTAALHNLYAYANANPITLVDPTGQTADADAIETGVLTGLGLFLAVVGMAVSLPGLSWGLIAVGIVLVGLVDVGISLAQATHEFGKKKFISNRTAAILTGITLGLGVIGLAGGVATVGKQFAKAAAKKSASDPDVAAEIAAEGQVSAANRRVQAAQTTATSKRTAVAEAEGRASTAQAKELTYNQKAIDRTDSAEKYKTKAATANDRHGAATADAARFRTEAAAADTQMAAERQLAANSRQASETASAKISDALAGYRRVTAVGIAVSFIATASLGADAVEMRKITSSLSVQKLGDEIVLQELNTMM